MHIHSAFNAAANPYNFQLIQSAVPNPVTQPGTQPENQQGKVPPINGSEESRDPHKNSSKNSGVESGELQKSSEGVEGEQKGARSKKKAFSKSLQLTPEEQKVVQKLRNRDREVKAHEQAHLAAAGAYARGGASYDYQTGPDGRRYAVGGEVSIDTSPVANDPEATLRKAQAIRRAANAPAKPSSQDRRVASQAASMESTARQEAALKRSEENKEESESPKSDQEVEPKPEEGKANPSSDSEKTTDQGREAGPNPPSIYKPYAMIQERGGDTTDVGNLLDSYL